MTFEFSRLPLAASKRSSSFFGISRAGCLLNILATNAKFNFSIPFAMSFGLTNSLKWDNSDSDENSQNINDKYYSFMFITSWSFTTSSCT